MNYNLYHAEDFAADESFIAYYLKTDTEAEAYWSTWISHNPEKLDEICNAEQLLSTLNLRLNDEELTLAFNRLDDFLKADAEAKNSYKKQRPTIFKAKNLAWSICLTLFMSIGSLYVYRSQVHKPIAYASWHTGYGKTAILTLGDGTKITLNANSTLYWPKSFALDQRNVQLEGEAFFEVAKDNNRPFNLYARGTKTTVLGTKFNILAYARSSKIQIALIEGRVEVKVKARRENMILKASEMASYSEKSGKLIRSNFNVEEVTGWKKGLLIFSQASFEEISQKIKNWYGIDLINHTKNIKWSFSGQFKKTDYLTIVKSICFSKNLKFQQTNNTIVLNQ